MTHAASLYMGLLIWRVFQRQRAASIYVAYFDQACVALSLTYYTHTLARTRRFLMHCCVAPHPRQCPIALDNTTNGFFFSFPSHRFFFSSSLRRLSIPPAWLTLNIVSTPVGGPARAQACTEMRATTHVTRTLLGLLGWEREKSKPRKLRKNRSFFRDGWNRERGRERGTLGTGTGPKAPAYCFVITWACVYERKISISMVTESWDEERRRKAKKVSQGWRWSGQWGKKGSLDKLPQQWGRWRGMLGMKERAALLGMRQKYKFPHLKFDTFITSWSPVCQISNRKYSK